MVRRALSLSIAITALVTAAPASADYIRVSQKLAARHLRPAPLVPTTAPRSLAPLDVTLEVAPTRRRSAYALGMRNAFRSSLIDTVIFLEGGEYKTIKAARRDLRGFRVRSTRIRGHRGYLATHRTDRTLLWTEGGRVYEMGSATPRTVSLKELRATAEGLDGLVGAFSGGVDMTAPDGRFSSHEAFLAATQRTFTADIDWTADCTAPNGSPGTQRAGRAHVEALPRRGDDFSFEIGPNVVQGDSPVSWQGTVSGTVNASGGTVNTRVTATVEGESCDSGPVSITLRPDS